MNQDDSNFPHKLNDFLNFELFNETTKQLYFGIYYITKIRMIDNVKRVIYPMTREIYENQI